MTDTKTAVVTGAAGFIGSHMVDLLLDRGYQVRAIDNLVGGHLRNIDHHQTNSNFTFENLDLRELDPNCDLFEDVDFVFHFAGRGDIVPSIEQPVDYVEANVMGTVRALEAARHAGACKFLYAASSSCYGLAFESPTSEEAEIDLQYPYALSKYLGEQAVHHWGSVYRMPVISIRIFGAYGPRARTSGVYGGVFGVFLAQKLAGKPFTVVGDGTQLRDFIFVTDVARAFLAAAESDRSQETYNLGSGDPQSVNRLVELLDGDVTWLPDRPGEPKCTWANISKIKDHLGWEPVVSFEEGVGTILQNIDYWKEAPLWDPSSIETATRVWFDTLSNEPQSQKTPSHDV